tara:strand:- start:279 stop:1691 length:1413 start_codon:yes stop_codon:yes gene_type:complete
VGFRGFLFFGLLFGLSRALPAADDQQPPNVLLITVDDLNDWVVGLDGHPQSLTPNIERLARRGVSFTNAHCQAPICNPSRTSFMTGLRPSTTGIYENRPWFRSTALNRNRVTLTEHFSANGYETFTAGKIYHGSRTEKRSFDHIGPTPGQVDKGAKRIQSDLKGLWDFGPQDYGGNKSNDYKDASWVIDLLDRKHAKPFFVALGFYRPHVPFYAPRKWFDLHPLDKVRLPEVKLDDWADLPEAARKLTSNSTPPPHDWFVKNGKWKPAVQAYLSCVSFMDAQVGRVLDALEKSAHAKNTIVVLFSDHGFHLGEKQRWAKQSLWETSTQVPMIFSVPGGLRGKKCSRPVELIQVFPTLVELCGIRKRKGLEGVSIKALLDDPSASWSRPALTTYKRNNHAVRSERWRYIRYSDGSEELYDHSKDPNEWTNLASLPAHAEVISEHARWLPKINVPNSAAGLPPKRQKKKKQR